MPRIGLFSFDFFPALGGQGRSFVEISRRLVERSPPGEVLTFSPCRNLLQYHHSILPSVRHLPTGQMLFSLLLSARFEAVIRRSALDLCFLNGGPGGILLAQKPSVPIVYCCNHTYSQQARFLPRQTWKRGLIPWERRTYSLANRLLAISPSTRDELSSRYGFRNVEVMGLGVDSQLFRPANEPVAEGSVLYLGRLERRKGIDFLIDSLPLVKEHNPGFRLFVGGSGSLRGRLQRTVRGYGLEQNVTFLGQLTEREKRQWLRRCAIHVTPSVFEGLGLSALESLASGAALVATRVPGLVDIVRDGENGILVDYADKVAMANALTTLLGNPAERARLRAQGRQSAEQRFDWNDVVDRLELLLREVLEQPA